MSYRDDLGAAHERIKALEKELAELRHSFTHLPRTPSGTLRGIPLPSRCTYRVANYDHQEIYTVGDRLTCEVPPAKAGGFRRLWRRGSYRAQEYLELRCGPYLTQARTHSICACAL
jgi:hypothetical protein